MADLDVRHCICIKETAAHGLDSFRLNEEYGFVEKNNLVTVGKISGADEGFTPVQRIPHGVFVKYFLASRR